MTASAGSEFVGWSTRGVFSRLGCAGILVPPANTTVEPELVAMLPDGMSLHANRLPGRTMQDTSIGLKERFEGYNATLGESADSFGGAPLDALVYACTGASYLVGPEGESELRRALQNGGVPRVHTAAGAVHDVLLRIGARSVALVTPYPEWLTRTAAGYWEAAGLQVVDVAQVPGVVSIYQISTDEAVATARTLHLDDADALVLSGTGMPTLQAIEVLTQSLDVPVLSSASCCAWWLVSTVAPEALTAAPLVRQVQSWVVR